MIVPTAIFAALLIIYPAEALFAARQGLNIWWEIVFPSMLPFFIAAELLLSLGAAHRAGKLLGPLMRPLFHLPGISAFVIIVSLLAGNPLSAKITSELRMQKLLTKSEAEKLIAIASFASPLFLFGAVAIGFFKEQRIGFVLAGAHYISALIVSLLIRFYPAKSSEKLTTPNKLVPLPKECLSFGALLGNAVQSAVHTLLIVGGFIIFFAVLTHLIDHSDFDQWFLKCLEPLLLLIGISPNFIHTLLIGSMEMTFGAQLASTSLLSLPLKLCATSFVIGFSGLSIHAQVASFLRKTDLSYRPYLSARILHGSIAALLTPIVFKLLVPALQDKSLATWTSSANAATFPTMLFALKCLSLGLLLFYGLERLTRLHKV
ncbi:MAG: sporulation integral rane protein YlbJ [Bacillota bacterium]|jgi:sporulation integral membrane protein YlbJ